MNQTLFVLILLIVAGGVGLVFFRLNNPSKKTLKQTNTTPPTPDTSFFREILKNKFFQQGVLWVCVAMLFFFGISFVSDLKQLLPYLVVLPAVFFVSYYAGNKDHYKNLPRAILSTVLTALILVLLVHPEALRMVFGPVVGSFSITKALADGSSGMMWLFGFTILYFLWRGQVVPAAVLALIFLFILSSGFCPS